MREERARERSSHSLLGLDGEGEDSVRSAALSVHGGGRHSPVHPPRTQNLVNRTTWYACITYMQVHVSPRLSSNKLTISQANGCSNLLMGRRGL